MDFKAFRRKTIPEAIEAFRMEAFKELNLEETPENLDTFQKAWKYGYSGGYEEVFEHFRDLVGIYRENGGEI